MTITVKQLADSIDPSRTILFFGSGSSLPSRAPTAGQLIEHFAKRFDLPSTGFTLSEIASLAESKVSRRQVIEALRELFKNLKPTGGLLNLPLYEWKSLFTTNYDTLIEQSYGRRDKPLTTYSSNFDFAEHGGANVVKLFKLHGTIDKDESDGNKSRIILTEADYDQTTVYREHLYDRLKGDLAGSRLIVIGHSLIDPDIREIVNRAAAINAQAENGGQIHLLLYTPDENRALLFEKRGLTVCFSGIDEFFAALVQRHFETPSTAISSDPLDQRSALRPVTIDVEHASDVKRSDVSAMFNGWPATHADILAGLTFERSVATEITNYLATENALVATLLGASGVGKTTAFRQALQRMRRDNVLCWEHKADLPLLVDEWVAVANHCRKENRVGALMIDDAHSHLYQINELADQAARLRRPIPASMSNPIFGTHKCKRDVPIELQVNDEENCTYTIDFCAHVYYGLYESTKGLALG